MKKIDLVMSLLVCCLILIACSKDQQPASNQKSENSGKLSVVTTLFPIYDFARSIGGTKADVSLLLPPGVEAHAFEPRPSDAVKTARAGLFIYTNRFMEPWAEKFVAGLGTEQLRVVDASTGVTLLPAGERHNHADHDHDHHHAAMDPHIWLDPNNAIIMVETIRQAMAAQDPANSAFYNDHAVHLKQQLVKLDADYRNTLSSCTAKTLLHGGHYAFGYLAKRYGLKYTSAMPVNADAEPTAEQMASLVKQIRKSGTQYIFSEEMISPRLTEAVAREAKVQVLTLHNLHNIGKQDLQAGSNYVSLMRKNLESLRIGLGCR